MARDPHHPRPLLRRSAWWSLDGPWEFALDVDAEHDAPDTVTFERTIIVPFAPEAPASGIGTTAHVRRCWYRRLVDVPPQAPGDRVLLHLGAVDHDATVWADGHRVAHHVGGWTPFTADLTEVIGHGAIEVVVRADDRPRTLGIARGKQDWQDEPHLIWYPRTTGIWQTVWLEVVPGARIDGLRWRGDPTDLSIHLVADATGELASGDRLAVRLTHGERTLVDDEVAIVDVTDGCARVERTFRVGRPGIDDAFELIWRPSHPALVDAVVELRRHDVVLDRVESYTAIRSVGIRDGRVELNGRPVAWRLALDQGYWPEGGMTAPSVDALRADVEAIKALGLHGVRKHQKVEDPRWLALCDEAGVVVWEELPSALAFDDDLPGDLARQWSEVVRRDRSHPCIVAWVPLNESWGVPTPGDEPAQRATIEALCALTRALDPTRLISANDGWETVGGDIVGVHDYDQDGERVAARYADASALDALFGGAAAGPSRRALTADGTGRRGRAVLVTEMGGTTLEHDTSGLFSYGNLTDPGAFLDRVGSLCAAVLGSPELSGYCWTQLTDTYQEANGLLRADRSPKVDLPALRAALAGHRPPAG